MSLRSTLRLWKTLRRLSVREYMLCEITCNQCGPRIESIGSKTSCLDFNYSDISDQKVDCAFCNIVRQCCNHFMEEEARGASVIIDYMLQDIDVRLRVSTSGFYEKTVQLYSKGRRYLLLLSKRV